jgi:imidazole glycerol phosphate synthase subunit HisF
MTKAEAALAAGIFHREEVEGERFGDAINSDAISAH